MKRLKRLLINLGFFTLVFSIFFTLLEIVVRKYHLFDAKISWSQPDPVLGYRFTPGAQYWFFDENDHPIEGRINNFGWRDRDWSLEKPKNMVRIAVLGDSFVEAFQVEEESTFLKISENDLNRTGSRNFELMNFGRSGFTTTEQLIIVEREILKFSPDMIVLFFFPENDIEDVSMQTSFVAMRPFYYITEDGRLLLDLSFNKTSDFKIKKTGNFFKQKSALVSLIGERYNLMKGITIKENKSASSGKVSSNGSYTKSRIKGGLSLATSHPDPKFTEAFALNKILLNKIHEICKQNKIRFLLVNVNLGAYHPDRKAPLVELDPTFDPTYFDTEMALFAADNNIEFIGLQKIFHKEFQKTSKRLQWTHWNYEGHKLVSKVLTNYLGEIYLNGNQLRLYPTNPSSLP